MTDILRQHQLVLLDMLKEFDRICKKNDIPYILFAGTALGAVRHGGFIPWDDDLDVIMLRPAYQRFLEATPGELGGDYYLQREFSPHWPMFFSKLRKNGTACMEKFRPKDPLMHQGVYIDIFPCDNLSDDTFRRRFQFAASKLVIARSLYQRGYITDSAKKKAIMQVSRLMPVRQLHDFVMDQHESHSQMVHSFFGACSRYEKGIYRREWFTETIPAQFEDAEFPISAHSDELLTQLYGDWHRIPSLQERTCKVHGQIVDLENSYEEYLEQQQSMKIDVLSRSIR